MIYSAYLNLLSQINFGKRAQLFLNDEIIYVTQNKDGFVLSSKVGEDFPLELSHYENFHLDAPGSKLVYTEEGLFFHQEVKFFDKFLQFKILMPNYLDLLRFWRGVVQDLEKAPLLRS